MKISILLVSTILFLSIFLPLAYLVLKSSGAEKRVKKALQRIGKEHELSLDSIELHGNLILALDGTQKKLLYTTRQSMNSNVQIIDLRNLSDCQIRTLRVKGQYLESVSLELINSNSKQSIVFYEELQDDGPVTDAMSSLAEAEKWKKLIQPLLRSA